ncbi:MAG TPA: hypothetical protein VD932_02440 [Aquabacterium sp.]|nr:hypothetical protein [Aquabacterium sp.]
MTTRAERDELRRLLAEATPGEWSAGGIFNPDSRRPSQHIWSARIKPEHQSGLMVAQDAKVTDARLIVAAHNALPGLLSELEECKAVIRDFMTKDEGHLEDDGTYDRAAKLLEGEG